MTKKTTMDTPTPPEPRPRKKKVDAQAKAPEKKELTAFDVMNMMNAARQQAEEDRQLRIEQRQLEREERKQRLYALLNEMVSLEPSGTEAGLGITRRDLVLRDPLSQNIMEDATRRFTYRNGRAFIHFEGSMVPVARKQGIWLARELSEALTQNTDRQWSTSLKDSLQEALASQAAAERITLPDSVEGGLTEATHSVDAISHLKTIQRLLEEKKDWQPRRESLKTSSKPVSVAEIVAREETSDDTFSGEDGWHDEPLDTEYAQAQRQAFERAAQRVRSKLPLIEDGEQRNATEKQLDLFIHNVDLGTYIEFQIESAHDRWTSGEQDSVLDDTTYTLLQQALDEEMYGKMEEREIT